jgi:hypothetical protein
LNAGLCVRRVRLAMFAPDARHHRRSQAKNPLIGLSELGQPPLKSADGSCHYDDVTSKKVGNHGACVKDSDAGFGLAIGTARMTKANIDYQHSIFRTIDTNTRQVGETAACVPPKGVGAGLHSIKIEDGRFKVMTSSPLDYEVNIDPQDPEHPPTKPVF